MANLLAERCQECDIKMVFRKGKIEHDRICCQDCPNENFVNKANEKLKDPNSINPCRQCSKYDHCSEQIKLEFLD
jgi:ssDNA-binding Zn-finger/Zn-ribbon topoisomerase 1